MNHGMIVSLPPRMIPDPKGDPPSASGSSKLTPSGVPKVPPEGAAGAPVAAPDDPLPLPLAVIRP